MKKLDKVILAIFSVFLLLQSILIICIISGLIDIDLVYKFVSQALADEKISKTILVIAVICLICAFKCIFFDDSEKENKSKGVLMQNDNGKLLISKATLENIVVSCVKDFSSVEDISVSTELDKLNNLIVNVNLVVNKNVIIKELTLNIQNKIKEAIKRTSDLEVKEVNVRIKNISNIKENNKE